MRRTLFPCLLLAAVAALHAAPIQEPETPPADPPGGQAQARSAVLELAGAFSNDGYKIRDGFYFGGVKPDSPAVVAVNLFAGNEYWFCAAANSPARKIAIKVYDEDGTPVEQQFYEDGARAAAGVVAGESGKFFVKVALLEGDASEFCFVYCYK